MRPVEGPPQNALAPCKYWLLGSHPESGLVILTFEVTAHVGDAGHRILHQYTKFEVRRPSGSEDIVDFRPRR